MERLDSNSRVQRLFCFEKDEMNECSRIPAVECVWPSMSTMLGLLKRPKEWHCCQYLRPVDTRKRDVTGISRLTIILVNAFPSDCIWSFYVLLDFLYYQVGQCQAAVGLHTHMSEGRANVDHKAGCRTHPTPYRNVLRSMSCIASSIYHYITRIMPFRTIISAIRRAGSEFITCTWYVFFGQPGTTTAGYHGWC